MKARVRGDRQTRVLHHAGNQSSRLIASMALVSIIKAIILGVTYVGVNQLVIYAHTVVRFSRNEKVASLPPPHKTTHTQTATTT